MFLSILGQSLSQPWSEWRKLFRLVNYGTFNSYPKRTLHTFQNNAHLVAASWGNFYGYLFSKSNDQVSILISLIVKFIHSMT